MTPTLEAIDTSKVFRGKVRFDYLMSHSNVLPGTPEFDNWILNFKDDPSDPEFNALLRAAKSEAARRAEQRSRKDERASIFPVQPSTADSEVDRVLRGSVDPTAASMRGRRGEHMGNPEVLVVQKDGSVVPAAESTDPAIGPDGKVVTVVKSSGQKTTPLVKGLPLTAKDILSGDPTIDGFIKGFYLDQGLELPDATEEAVVRTGEYVYVGETTYAETTSEAGYSRPTYLHVDQADASVVDLGAETIKAYQEQLGIPATGIVDPQLAKLWHQAVVAAASYAMRGQKVPLKFIFDSLVALEVANGGFGGGGGGGGGSANQLTIDDYYFYMMQVLGDISGVKS